LLGMVAAGLIVLPRDKAAALKAGIRDAALPGQRLALSLKRQAESLVPTLRKPSTTNVQSPEAASELRRLGQQLRALRLENARLHEQIAALERQRALPVAGSPGEALIVPD